MKHVVGQRYYPQTQCWQAECVEPDCRWMGEVVGSQELCDVDGRRHEEATA